MTVEELIQNLFNAEQKIKELEAEIARTNQQPEVTGKAVAWRWKGLSHGYSVAIENPFAGDSVEFQAGREVTPLYLAPPDTEARIKELEATLKAALAELDELKGN